MATDLQPLTKRPPRGAQSVREQIGAQDGPRRSATPAGDAIALDEVERGFVGRRGERVHALAGVSLRAARGELLAIVGPSGCGKTTLLELICGLQAADGGTVQSEPAVLMPQRDLLLPWLDARDNAALALRVRSVPRAQARARAAALFAELGLEGFERAHPGELSGGMRQRVAFARTLLAGKPVLCMDEPFGALDAITRAEMQDWLVRALSRAPRTVVLVTHDVEEAVVLADRVLVLSPRPGRVAGEIEVTLPRPRGRTHAQVVALRELALGLLSSSASVSSGSASAASASLAAPASIRGAGAE